jgi:hypothetical protein
MAMEDTRHMLIVQVTALITALYTFMMTSIRVRLVEEFRPTITYGPMHVMDEERQRNLNLIYNSNDIEYVNMLRMRRAPFFHLVNLFRERNLLRDSIHSCVKEQVAMFLYVVGHNQRFRVVHHNWRRCVETISRYFNEVLFAIGELRDEMIRGPPNETPLNIRNNHIWFPYFKVT